MEPCLRTVLERVEELERQNRRLKRAGLLALLAAAPIVWMGQIPVPRTFDGREFAVVDGTGKVRAVLGVEGTYPNLTFRDANGRPRLRLGLTAEGATLTVVDASGKMRDFLSDKPTVRPLTQDPR